MDMIKDLAPLSAFSCHMKLVDKECELAKTKLKLNGLK